jgi:CRP-like cAMP-binding protein
MFNQQQPSTGGQITPTNTTAPISQQECIELLAHIPLFCELSRSELRRLASAATQREYPAGTRMVHQGEPGVGLYVLISGRARVQQQLADGSTRELALLGGARSLEKWRSWISLPGRPACWRRKTRGRW